MCGRRDEGSELIDGILGRIWSHGKNRYVLSMFDGWVFYALLAQYVYRYVGNLKRVRTQPTLTKESILNTPLHQSISTFYP
jgi:hypothetical protein